MSYPLYREIITWDKSFDGNSMYILPTETKSWNGPILSPFHCISYSIPCHSQIFFSFSWNEVFRFPIYTTVYHWSFDIVTYFFSQQHSLPYCTMCLPCIFPYIFVFLKMFGSLVYRFSEWERILCSSFSVIVHVMLLLFMLFLFFVWSFLGQGEMIGNFSPIILLSTKFWKNLLQNAYLKIGACCQWFSWRCINLSNTWQICQ